MNRLLEARIASKKEEIEKALSNRDEMVYFISSVEIYCEEYDCYPEVPFADDSQIYSMSNDELLNHLIECNIFEFFYETCIEIPVNEDWQ